MNPEALATELEKEPFRPLLRHLTDGRTVLVENPDIAVIANLALYLFKVRREHTRIADDTDVISLRHIVSFEPLETRENGRRRKRRN